MSKDERIQVRGLLESYLKLIENAGGKNPSAVLSDIEASIKYVLNKENKND